MPGTMLLEHDVEPGDVWRMCQAKDLPIQDWVKLAVKRARLTGAPAVFWLDEARAHDAQLHRQGAALPRGPRHRRPEIEIMSPVEATKFSLERIRRGEDTISVTGNVLRDYLTDLFPILELGTSAKMLSIVPAHERRRPLRDRRRRLGPEARAAARAGEPPALGLARGVPRAGQLLRAPRPDHRQRRRPRCWPTRSTRPPAGSSRRTGRHRARSARSTTAAATSTWPASGPRRWPARPRIPRWRRASPPWPRRWPTRRRPWSTSSWRSRAGPPTSAATTAPTSC